MKRVPSWLTVDLLFITASLVIIGIGVMMGPW